jgi:hypothetical protein
MGFDMRKTELVPTKVVITIDACNHGCPHCGEKLTKGFGYAMDFFCKLSDNKIVSGYVEWDSDLNPVPEWCPLRLDSENMKQKAYGVIQGIDI